MYDKAPIKTEAEELNEKLSKETQALLSPFGKKAYYPKSGVPGQTNDAKGTRINATLGQAFADERDEKGKLIPLTLPSFVRAHKNLKETEIFPYAPTHGFEPVRTLWGKEIQRKNPSLEGRISNPVAVSGIAHGLTILNELFVEPNDELVHFTPFWGNYNLHFKDAKMNSIPIYNHGRELNLSLLEQTLSGEPKKRIILFNFPSNPTGYVPSIKEKEEMKRILWEAAERENKLVVISDDAYFGLVYEEGRTKESPFADLANLHENILAVKVDGVTKETYAWGLRLGFLTYGRKGMSEKEAQALEDKTAGRVRATSSNVCTASQWTAFYGIQDPEFSAEVLANKAILQKRYDSIQRELKSHPEWEESFKALPFNGGYFMCTELRDKDTEKVRRIVRENYNTGVLSLTGTNILRLAYSAVPHDDIPELFENIHQACKSSQ